MAAVSLDFERWFQRQAPVLTLDERLEEIGFSVHSDGSVHADCCICRRDIALTDYVSADECLREDPNNQYCGGSPQCCP